MDDITNVCSDSDEFSCGMDWEDSCHDKLYAEFVDWVNAGEPGVFLGPDNGFCEDRYAACSERAS